jgi:membrane-bound metal-dependent hydrolase YbcI (DUF457 family)
MPLTPAHTAAAWPLSRLLPPLPLDALVLGTMLPDFEYLLHLAPRGGFGHSLPGLFVFCLPIGLVTWAIYRRVVRPACLTLLPAGLRPALAAGETNWVAVIAAILVGAASHSLWDSFTHERGWSVQRIPALSTTVHLGALGEVPIFKLLQHGSTIVGLAAVTVWVWRWVRRQPASAWVFGSQPRVRAVRILAMLFAVGAAGAFLNGLRGIGRGMAAALGHAAVGGMAALLAAFLVFGLVTRPAEKARAPAP